jgi:hypothetical protein
LYNALFTDMVGKCGLKEELMKAQYFISPFQDK